MTDTAVESLKVTRSSGGQVTATVTINDGPNKVSWAVKTYSNQVAAGVKQARRDARAALKQIEESNE